ncbi:MULTISPECIES: hypothetical protein [Sphingomonas]|uniref:Uncharacterized protein n=1 Tax=Sphingomonas leidyi TaxID=68569 RepID=A0A7X5UZP4_9SPHN|nr:MULTISPECIES: hypothetical protein [Sphingomonas]MBN8812996.1 hypothetical protein [Sphingomonas sp.]NIJ65209.1 hypothetical protein [Sphingomonas leidyi]OJY51098.1 MAG: hypothetical protein BGP17_22325 [Sphingomonas sp. 67-41]
MARWPGARALPFIAALSWLCLGAHELAHHLTGRIVCGAWGGMTLATFTLPETCPDSAAWIAALAGPALSWLLIYAGVALRGQLGLFLIFANLPLARIVTVATGGGDERIIGKALFGEALAFPAMVAITMALALPPLILAWGRLPRRHRLAGFAALLVLPLLWDLLFKRMAMGALLPADPVWNGVPAVILASHLVAAVLLILTWPRTATERFPC